MRPRLSRWPGVRAQRVRARGLRSELGVPRGLVLHLGPLLGPQLQPGLAMRRRSVSIRSVSRRARRLRRAARPYAACDSTVGVYCANFASDSSDCGGCGDVCAAGQVCDGTGRCSVQCVVGETLCAGRCYQLSTDNAHCGGCDSACAAGQVCSAGACSSTCAAPLSLCGTGASMPLRGSAELNPPTVAPEDTAAVPAKPVRSGAAWTIASPRFSVAGRAASTPPTTIRTAAPAEPAVRSSSGACKPPAFHAAWPTMSAAPGSSAPGLGSPVSTSSASATAASPRRAAPRAPRAPSICPPTALTATRPTRRLAPGSPSAMR